LLDLSPLPNMPESGFTFGQTRPYAVSFHD
jgi:hypothetical protein